MAERRTDGRINNKHINIKYAAIILCSSRLDAILDLLVGERARQITDLSYLFSPGISVLQSSSVIVNFGLLLFSVLFVATVPSVQKVNPDDLIVSSTLGCTAIYVIAIAIGMSIAEIVQAKAFIFFACGFFIFNGLSSIHSRINDNSVIVISFLSNHFNVFVRVFFVLKFIPVLNLKPSMSRTTSHALIKSVSFTAPPPISLQTRSKKKWAERAREMAQIISVADITIETHGEISFASCAALNIACCCISVDDI